MNDEWLTTGEAARLLGFSRQHVVDMCNRGELSCSTIGTHRRILRSVIHSRIGQPLTREQEKSLWLHRALLTHIMLDPKTVLQAAHQNIASWKPKHRGDSMVSHYLDLWEQVLDDGVDRVAAVLTGTDETSMELRQNSPFAGILTDDERQRVLRSFREHWAEEHRAA